MLMIDRTYVTYWHDIIKLSFLIKSWEFCSSNKSAAVDIINHFVIIFGGDDDEDVWQTQIIFSASNFSPDGRNLCLWHMTHICRERETPHLKDKRKMYLISIIIVANSWRVSCIYIWASSTMKANWIMPHLNISLTSI